MTSVDVAAPEESEQTFVLPDTTQDQPRDERGERGRALAPFRPGRPLDNPVAGQPAPAGGAVKPAANPALGSSPLPGTSASPQAPAPAPQIIEQASWGPAANPAAQQAVKPPFADELEHLRKGAEDFAKLAAPMMLMVAPLVLLPLLALAGGGGGGGAAPGSGSAAPGYTPLGDGSGMPASSDPVLRQLREAGEPLFRGPGQPGAAQAAQYSPGGGSGAGGSGLSYDAQRAVEAALAAKRRVVEKSERELTQIIDRYGGEYGKHKDRYDAVLLRLEAQLAQADKLGNPEERRRFVHKAYLDALRDVEVVMNELIAVGKLTAATVRELAAEIDPLADKLAKQYLSDTGAAVADMGNFGYAVQTAEMYGWGPDDLAAWHTLGMKESGWRSDAQNPRTSAYGIGQFVDATWRTVGGTKTSDPGLQVEYMARYIHNRYGRPSQALAFHRANNWY